MVHGDIQDIWPVMVDKLKQPCPRIMRLRYQDMETKTWKTVVGIEYDRVHQMGIRNYLQVFKKCLCSPYKWRILDSENKLDANNQLLQKCPPILKRFYEKQTQFLKEYGFPLNPIEGVEDDGEEESDEDMDVDAAEPEDLDEWLKALYRIKPSSSRRTVDSPASTQDDEEDSSASGTTEDDSSCSGTSNSEDDSSSSKSEETKSSDFNLDKYGELDLSESDSEVDLDTY